MIAQSLKGIGASAGIAIAKAYRLEEPELIVERRVIGNIEAEVQRLDATLGANPSQGL
ncbi:phosphoenolpyruvate-protein kinase (PTS system EI component) [Peribacillus huizhouensis]|uniref:Phosphoenolpyruvate-protein kinase (PTS system EI component) n=1 Tax=Peribacillus huizhouensis TaxID=1501239 RepID=A0ABR6CV47_9BACI|nr:phosphoenolpyruvate-protein kinase (PTS system EI component) [Peribacillus huizhouensis]